MTEPNKPEWFEIIDKDEKPELRKVSKSLPVSAVLVAALILGVGAAQTQNVTPFSALNPDATQAIHSDANPVTVAAEVVGTVVTNKLANPAISKLPTGGDDEDEHDDNEDDDEDEDDEDDEDDEEDD